MNDSPPNPSSPGFDPVQFARATRFAFVAIVLCISYFSMRTSLAIGHFETIYRDMLGGKPLPPVTQWVMYLRTLFVLVSLFIPLTALATLCMSNLTRAVTILGWLIPLALVELVMLSQALSAPLFEIFKQMGGTGTP
jgi:hypothetical protein